MGKEEKEKEPELKVCRDTEVCESFYVQTDVTFGDGWWYFNDKTILAGSWKKSCTRRSDKHITDIFGEDISDGCKDVPYTKVCTINADFCPNVCDLIYVSIHISNSFFI